MFFLIIFSALVTQITMQQANITETEVDALGGLARFVDEVLIKIFAQIPSPTNDTCTPFMFIFGKFRLTVAKQPYGYCSFCCPLTNPADHVRLHFTNKVKYNNPVRMRMTRKAGTLHSAGINKNLTTVFYIHGFGETVNAIDFKRIRNAYLSRPEDYNIMMVDWINLSAIPWYVQAIENLKLIAHLLAEFIKFYNATGELPISKIHLVGFSLGAQFSGYVGKFLGPKQKLPRITALDPAFPLFPPEDVAQRISASDAEFVDVIHTDTTFGYRYPFSLGHADFYPNAGSLMQPGCQPSMIAIDLVLCNHFRAVEFYVESVRNPRAFPATKCLKHKNSSKRCQFTPDAYMGFPASKTTTLGNFYVTTNNRSPFARSAEEQKNDPVKIPNF